MAAQQLLCACWAVARGRRGRIYFFLSPYPFPSQLHNEGFVSHGHGQFETNDLTEFSIHRTRKPENRKHKVSSERRRARGRGTAGNSSLQLRHLHRRPRRRWCSSDAGVGERRPSSPRPLAADAWWVGEFRGTLQSIWGHPPMWVGRDGAADAWWVGESGGTLQ